MKFPLTAGLLLSGCALLEPSPEPRRPALAPASIAAAPIALDKIIVNIPRGAEVGRYIFFLNCRPPWGAVTWGEMRRHAPEAELTDQLFQELAAAGFTLVGGRQPSFAPQRTAEFKVAARIEAVDMRLCRQTDWLFGYNTGISGETTVTVHWDVFSERARTVVMTAQTVGRAERSTGTTDGAGLLIVDAFADAAAQLARDPALVAAISAAATPAVTEAVAPLAGVPSVGARLMRLQVGEAVYGGIRDRSRRESGIIAGLRWDEARQRWIILADLPHTASRPDALYDAAGLQIGVAAPDSVGDVSAGLLPFLALTGQP